MTVTISSGHLTRSFTADKLPFLLFGEKSGEPGKAVQESITREYAEMKGELRFEQVSAKAEEAQSKDASSGPEMPNCGTRAYISRERISSRSRHSGLKL
jgi:hypothetical protein